MKRACLWCIIGLCYSTGVLSQVRDYWPSEGWQTRSLEEAGMNAWLIGEMEQLVISSMSFVDAFLVVKDGYLVYERYFNAGYNETDYHSVASVTKSITGIMIGVLLKEHYIDSLDQKILGFFPEYSEVNEDPRIRLLTIRHIMSYTSGLDHDEDDWYVQDIIEKYLGNGFFADPGDQFRYATPASEILSAIVSKRTGRNTFDYASAQVFPKLGITNVKWPSDYLGYSYGGFGTYFVPRDMLKFGFLYLNRGIWAGDTIVDPSFVSLCTMAHSDGGKPHNENYGYNWWITENNGYHAFFAGGYGGQFIYVVPDLDLVVAITCRSDQHREDARFLINTHVVPAILNPVWQPTGLEENNCGITVFPNPFEGEMSISFEVNEPTRFTFYITDPSGRIVYTTTDNMVYPPGKHMHTFRPGLPAGIYFINGNAGSGEYHTKTICIK